MRLDKFLVKKFNLKSRSKAIALIKLGKVKVNGKIIKKQAYEVKEEDIIGIISKHIYSSRAGYKLEEFLKDKPIKLENKTILDIGCSYGGFTDYFLKHNCKEIVAIDVVDLLDEKLKDNPKVKFFQIDVTKKDQLKEKLRNKKFDIITIDVSKVNPKIVIENIKDFLNKDGKIILLFKPQYMENYKKLPNQKLLDEFISSISQEFKVVDVEESKVRGNVKNTGIKEIFIMLEKRSSEN